MRIWGASFRGRKWQDAGGVRASSHHYPPVLATCRGTTTVHNGFQSAPSTPACYRLSPVCSDRKEPVSGRTELLPGPLCAEAAAPGQCTHSLGLKQTQGHPAGSPGSLAAHASTRCRSPLTAVRLEDLWLDHLIAGTAHDQVEVIVGWIMAK